jgi:hypothetical protein
MADPHLEYLAHHMILLADPSVPAGDRRRRRDSLCRAERPPQRRPTGCEAAKRPAVAARAPRRGGAAGGAARVDGIRQFLVVADVARTLSSSALRTGGLTVFISVVAVTFSLAARATGGVDREQRRALPGQMAHSLILIVVGYIFAHYLTYLVEREQRAVFALADPFGHGWNLLGLTHFHVAYVLSTHPPVLAGIKVASVVTGHIVAVVAAHDKALRLLPAGHQLTGQLTMMLVMVGYTFTGLYLLFGG